MPEEKILPHMKPVVLAKNDPAIIGVFPHPYLRLKAIWLGRDGLNRSKLMSLLGEKNLVEAVYVLSDSPLTVLKDNCWRT